MQVGNLVERGGYVKKTSGLFVGLWVGLSTGLLWAAEGAAGAGQAAPHSVEYFRWTVIVASVALALAAMACGVAQAIVVRKGLEGIARQPEATGQIQTAMILGLAFIESLVIYVLLISLILLFVNPFAKYFIG